jgi:hypothetical protein
MDDEVQNNRNVGINEGQWKKKLRKQFHSKVLCFSSTVPFKSERALVHERA